MVAPNIERHAEYFCRRLIFTPANIRRQMEVKIVRHLARAADLIAENLPDCNLYVSGSLARGEPSLAISSHSRRLYSDVDFVVVGDVPPDNLQALEGELRNRFSEFFDTLYFLPSANLNRLVSASARDLSEGMAYPILSNRLLPAPNPVLGLGELLEVLVYQVAGALLVGFESAHAGSTTFWHCEAGYQRLKALTDLLRALAFAAGGDATLMDAWRLRKHALFTSVLSADCVEQLICARENWSDEPRSLTSILPLVLRRALRVLLRAQDDDPANLTEMLRATFYDDAIPFHAFPLVALGACLMRGTEDSKARSRLWQCITPAANILAGDAIGVSHPPDVALLVAILARSRQSYLLELTTRKDRGGAIWRRFQVQQTVTRECGQWTTA